jgi:hypothetical protein
MSLLTAQVLWEGTTTARVKLIGVRGLYATGQRCQPATRLDSLVQGGSVNHGLTVGNLLVAGTRVVTQLTSMILAQELDLRIHQHHV